METWARARMGLTALALSVMSACHSTGAGFEPRLRSSVGFGVLWMTSTWSPDGRSLLRYTETDGREGLFRFDLDHEGAEPVLIAESGILPAYSPDGSRIAVILSRPEDPEPEPSSGHGRRGDLWLMNADGTERRRIEPGMAVPAWSPDGRWLAITDLEREEPVITLLQPESGERRPLGPGALPVWSPDGARLACTIGRREEADPRIAIVEADGSGRRGLARGNWPSWSPDGRWLAFQDQDETAEGVSSIVFVIAADGSECRRLGPGVFPRWSPAGDRILYYCFTDDALVTVASDGTDERVLASGGPGLWSPDGTQVVFGRPFDVVLVGAEGGEVRPVWPAILGVPATRAAPSSP